MFKTCSLKFMLTRFVLSGNIWFLLLTAVIYFDNWGVRILWPIPKRLARQFSTLGLYTRRYSNTCQRIAFLKAFSDFVRNITIFYFFLPSFGEMAEDSYKLIKAILFIYLGNIEKSVILPSMYYLFLLHVSRPSRFLTNVFFLFFLSLCLYLFLKDRDIPSMVIHRGLFIA